MTKHMEQGLEFDTQLTKTPENVTCAGLSNMDERRAALDALDEIGAAGFIYELGEHIETIRSALTAPRVPVIDGLDEALKKYSFGMPDMSDYESVGHYLNDEAEYRKASSIVEKAARAYAELQKGV